MLRATTTVPRVRAVDRTENGLVNYGGVRWKHVCVKWVTKGGRDGKGEEKGGCPREGYTNFLFLGCLLDGTGSQRANTGGGYVGKFAV